ncbi:MAG: dTMP kinase [Thermoprotei archaeon]
MSESINNGFFLVLEGIDGSGKTSIANKLVEELTGMGYKVVYTYEPWDSYYIKILKEHYSFVRDAALDALTYAADRLIHIRLFIKPYLERGFLVICDRYYYSSVAYQSAQGADLEWVLEINKYVLNPDLAIYLDVDPLTGLRRRQRLRSRFPEYEELDLLYRVREIYLELVRRGYMILVDARRDFDSVYKDVKNLVLAYLRKTTSHV